MDEFTQEDSPFRRNSTPQAEQLDFEGPPVQQSAPVNPYSGRGPGANIRTRPDKAAEVMPATQGF